MGVDRLSDALNQIKLNDRVGNKEVVLEWSSKLIKNVLAVLKEEGYIEDFEPFDDGGKERVRVLLKGAINELRAIKPRLPVKYVDIIKAEAQYLPAYNIGILIISTPKGVMSNKKAKELHLGGRLLAYVY
jgi:small subunit ribosomal protein S8